MTAADGLRFAILGPLEVTTAVGDPVRVDGRLTRSLLGHLLLWSDRDVPAEVIAAALWPDDDPHRTRGALKTQIWSLRRLLRAAGDRPDRIATTSRGYRVRVSGGELDSAHFGALLDAAEEHAGSGDPDAAAQGFAEALALWRGPVLAGCDLAEDVLPLTVGWSERRTAAVEAAARADLECGRAAAASARVRAELVREPLHEGLWLIRMQAQLSCGRPAAALQTYERARRTLADELGVDPGRALTGLYQRILAAGAGAGPTGGARPVPARGTTDRPAPATARLSARAVALAGDPRESVRSTPAAAPLASDRAVAGERDVRTGSVARQAARSITLPAAPAVLAGRQADLRRVRDYLGAPDLVAGTTLVTGLAGTGKSALVLRAARDAAGDPVYLDVCGTRSDRDPLTPAAVTTGLLRASGDPVIGRSGTADDPDELADRLRAAVAGRLVVLDNVAHAGQVRTVLPLLAGATVLLTARAPLTELDLTHRLRLGPLPLPAAVEVLGALVGRHRRAREHDSLARVAGLCGRLPLTLRIAGARLAAFPGLGAGELAARLAVPGRRLAELRCGDLDARSMFEAGHRDLLDAVPDDGDVACALADIVSATDPRDPVRFRVPSSRPGMERLVEHGLVVSTGRGRFVGSVLLFEVAIGLAPSCCSRGVVGASHAPTCRATSAA